MESQLRFVFADISVELRHFCRGNVRWVAHDVIESRLCSLGRQDIAFDKSDAVGHTVAFRVSTSDCKRGRADVDRGHMRVGDVLGSTHGENAAAGADVRDFRYRWACWALFHMI